MRPSLTNLWVEIYLGQSSIAHSASFPLQPFPKNSTPYPPGGYLLPQILSPCNWDDYPFNPWVQHGDVSVARPQSIGAHLGILWVLDLYNKVNIIIKLGTWNFFSVHIKDVFTPRCSICNRIMYIKVHFNFKLFYC